jgi:hypothetical protein
VDKKALAVIIHCGNLAAMTLDAYLRARREAGESAHAFALRAKLTDAAVSRYRLGVRHPEPDAMQKIIDASGGEVTANDFFVMQRTSRPTRKARLDHRQSKAS